MREPTACPICRDGGPVDVIVGLPGSWVTAPIHAPLPGYACVVARRHVVEPFELPADEMDGFWRECMVVARALDGLLTPSKMNYEIHGNTIPHLHMHLYPRFDGDPYQARSIDGSASFERTAERLGQMAAAVRQQAKTGE